MLVVCTHQPLGGAVNPGSAVDGYPRRFSPSLLTSMKKQRDQFLASRWRHRPASLGLLSRTRSDGSPCVNSGSVAESLSLS